MNTIRYLFLDGSGFVIHLIKLWTRILNDIMKFLKVLFLLCDLNFEKL